MKNSVNEKQFFSKIQNSSTDELLDLIKKQSNQIKYYQSHDLSPFLFGQEKPRSQAAENAVLGACLIDSSCFQIVRNVLDENDFYETNHSIIFKAMRELIETNKSKLDLITLTDFLQKKYKKEFDAFGAYYLVELSNTVGSAANVEYHARIVKQNSIARLLIQNSLKTIKSVYDGTDVFDIAETLTKSLSLKSLNPIFVGGTAQKVMEMAKTAKDIKNLCGNIFKTGDLTLFLAPKKTGKTVLGYQMADAIAKGEGLFQNVLNVETPEKKRVLYIDMEMNLADFKNRYINAQSGKEYPFSENLFIQMINPSNFDFEQEAMLREIEKLIIEFKPDVLITDNLTALMKSISDADSALIAIKTFLRWKHEHNCSMMIMCHTPKRLGNLPLTSDDILGSGIFLNLATSIFGIRRSFQDRGIVYLKHLDTRNTSLQFDEDNVILMRIDKIDNFTQMCFEGFGKEIDHLAKKNDSEAEGEIFGEAIKKYNSGASWAKVKQEINYEYSAQALQKSCIKYAERSKSYTYIPAQQKFVDWFENVVTEVTEVPKVTEPIPF